MGGIEAIIGVLRSDSLTWERGLGRFRTEGPRRVSLRSLGLRERVLPRQLFVCLYLVVAARQRREEGDEINNSLRGSTPVGLSQFRPGR